MKLLIRKYEIEIWKSFHISIEKFHERKWGTFDLAVYIKIAFRIAVDTPILEGERCKTIEAFKTIKDCKKLQSGK